MNITQADKKVIELINYYSISGNVISAADPNGLDYRLRFRDLYDTCQKEIATTAKKIRKTKKIVQSLIPNQLSGYTQGFGIAQHYDEDIIFEAVGSKSYYFEVNNPCVVYIEEETSDGVWTILATITDITTANSFTQYKGNITASNVLNSIRIRLSGANPYCYRNLALYAYSFVNDASVQQWSQYITYTMPTDFHKLIDVVEESSINFYWEKDNILKLYYQFIGEVTINYAAKPVTIDSLTVEATEFEVSFEACEAIPYYVASHMMLDENANISNKLFAIYQGKLGNMDDTTPNGSTTVKNKLFQYAKQKLFINNGWGR